MTQGYIRMARPKKVGDRRTDEHDWTTVPGWDPATQQYIGLDCERWIRENGIREAGRENGKEEFPRSDAVQPDDMYMKIRAWVNERGRTCYAEVSDHLRMLRNALELEAKEGMAPVQHIVKGLRDHGKVELRNQGEKDRTILAQKEREAREAWKALETFKKRANLERAVEYGERDTWYWWLIGIVAIEAVANSMMLAGVHEYGLLGAMAIMVAIGVVNAGMLGGLIGEGWRQKNALGLFPTLRGWIIVAAGATLMGLWNLLVGHFRDSMLAVTTRAASGTGSLGDLLADDTIERFVINPMGLEDMQSWVLAVIGVGCGIFAATKWLNRDDGYPGYGAVHRITTEHNEEYARDIEERRSELTEVYERYVGRIRDERLKVENKKGSHQLHTDTAREIVRQFRMQLSQYQDNLDFILAAYRSENEKVRTTPSPKFFAEKFLIDQDMLEAPPWEEVPPPDYEPDWKGFQQGEDAIRKAYQEAQAGYPSLEDLMEGESARERLRP